MDNDQRRQGRLVAFLNADKQPGDQRPAFNGEISLPEDPIERHLVLWAHATKKGHTRDCPKLCVSSFRSVLFPLLLCFFSALKKQSDRRTGWRTAPWRPSIQWAFANARLHF